MASENPLDPDDPLVSKHDMITWLYDRDRTTTLPTKLTRSQLAAKVREAQPDVFPQSSNKDPAFETVNTMKATSGKVARTETEATSKNDPNLNGPQFASTSVPATAAGVRKGSKRLASGEGELPRQKRTTLEAGTSSSTTTWKVSKKTKKPQRDQAGAHILDTGHLAIETVESTKPAISPSVFANQIDAGLLAAANLATKSAWRRIPPEQHQADEPHNALIAVSHTDGREIKEENPESTTDLMEFPLLDLFESENPITGRGIQPIPVSISFASSSQKRSGVDVFQDERKKEGKLLELEERVAKLENQADDSELKRKILCLEEQVQKLASDIHTMREEVEAHDETLVGLMTLDEEQEGSLESESSEE